MDSQQIMAWSLVGLAAINLITMVALLAAVPKVLKALTEVTTKSGAFLTQMQEETTATLQQAHDSLARIETLTQTAEKMIREDLTPTLNLATKTLKHVDDIAEGVSEGVASVRKIVGTVQAVAAPGALAASLAQAVRTPSGKASILASAVTVGFGALMRARASHDQPKKPAAETAKAEN